MGEETHLYFFFDLKMENKCFNHYLCMHSSRYYLNNNSEELCAHYRSVSITEDYPNYRYVFLLWQYMSPLQ